MLQREWIVKRDMRGAEQLMIKLCGLTAIQMISQQRMTKVAEMYPNLMRPSRMQSYSDQCPVITALFNPVFGSGKLTIGTDLASRLSCYARLVLQLCHDRVPSRLQRSLGIP